MKQYNAIKAKYPDALLLFRVGDFYETFGSDAIKASEILDIILTKRGAGSQSETELAGFPHHSLNTYLPKLVKAGERVAICDQLEDPKKTKKYVGSFCHHLGRSWGAGARRLLKSSILESPWVPLGSISDEKSSLFVA